MCVMCKDFKITPARRESRGLRQKCDGCRNKTSGNTRGQCKFPGCTTGERNMGNSPGFPFCNTHVKEVQNHVNKHKAWPDGVPKPEQTRKGVN
jgi:hypothetical protein